MSTDPFITATPDAKPRPTAPLPPAKPWRADRPGDLAAHQPQGGHYGYQGPDQGYALRLASLFRAKVTLAQKERWEDAAYGVVGIALRRASHFGRAPVKDDLEVGFLCWGYLVEGVPDDVVYGLADRRKRLFADVVHDSRHQRLVADSVPLDVLTLSPDEVRARVAAGEVLVSEAG